MRKKSPEDAVDSLLVNAKRGARATFADKYPELTTAIVRFLDLKKEGDPRVVGVSWSWFYTHKLREHFGGPGRLAASEFVRDSLRRCVVTGGDL
jgi:hypothetical protein